MKKKLLVVSCCALPILCAPAAYSADGLYLGANLGVAMLSDSDVENNGDQIELSFDTGLALGAAVGYRYGDMRIEGEFGYQKNDIDKTSAMGFDFESNGDVSGLGLLVNGYYDFTNTTAFTPYITAGLGFANIEISDYTISGLDMARIDDDDTVFAYQLGLGVGYAVNQNFIIDLKYRYFATADPKFDGAEAEIASHNILVGVRYNF